MITSPAFRSRKFAILGLARSGLATAYALAESGAELVAWDSRQEARDAVADIAHIADPMEYDLRGFDGIILSPGVPLNRHPVSAKALSENVPIIGDIEVFSMARASLPRHKVVGITGTNGKSTTTALVHHLCRQAGMPSLMAGNIGLPIMSQEPLAEGGVYVLELSSYQIDLTHSLDCDVAAILNLSPDHLDRYDGVEGYYASKARLFAMQSARHHAIFGDADDNIIALYDHVRAARDDGYCTLAHMHALKGQADWPSLQGPHNLQNAAVAVAIAKGLGIPEQSWRAGLANFSGLAHRMEIVAEKDGVLFVNDSKATNAASTAPALAAYPHIHWILGGIAKTDNLDECIPNFGNVKCAYTIGEAGPMFNQLLAPHMPVEPCELMATAVMRATENAKPGDVVMLSPACASFDQFKDFEARGDCFRAIVQSILS